MGIISPVREGHFKNRHQPSRWKLNMFPFDGEPATHDYLTDRERRGIRRNRKRREVTWPATSTPFLHSYIWTHHAFRFRLAPGR